VTSKFLGVGSAKRHWKIVKDVKSGHESHMVTVKAKAVALIHSATMIQQERARAEILCTTGKL
jgi:hypothetical protein